jgi:hypothetical protein
MKIIETGRKSGSPWWTLSPTPLIAVALAIFFIALARLPLVTVSLPLTIAISLATSPSRCHCLYWNLSLSRLPFSLLPTLTTAYLIFACRRFEGPNPHFHRHRCHCL